MATGATDTSQEKGPQREAFIIDIEHVGDPNWGPECCIYKVPKRLSKVKEQAYTPKLISIGPVHHNKGELKDIQMIKERYFKAFFSRTCKGQKEFACIIEKNKDKIRNCYAPEISLHTENENFMEMVLLDSIFIIELFLRSDRKEDENDYILSKPWLKDGIMQDLILLENQLPFFILDKLYQHFTGTSNFLALACNYFFSSKEIRFEKEAKHFTDLLRNFFQPPNQKPGNPIEDLYSATKLDRAGLNFKEWKKKPLEGRCLLDIQIKKPNRSEICSRYCSWLLDPCLKYFERLKYFECLKYFERLKLMQTTLVIPQFVINHGTEHIFRNIMALEQCHYPSQAYICNYIVLLNFLIITSDDVELLVDKKIIVHSLGSSKEVAIMVNKLGKEIVEENSYYLQVAKNLKEHYEYWWNKNIVSFKTVIFRDIWRSTTTFFGIMVMLATIGSFLTPFVYHK